MATKTLHLSGWCQTEAGVRNGEHASSTTPEEWHDKCWLAGCECPNHGAPGAPIKGQRDIFGGEVA